MQYGLKCPICKQQFIVDDEAEGDQSVCPRCRNRAGNRSCSRGDGVETNEGE